MSQWIWSHDETTAVLISEIAQLVLIENPHRWLDRATEKTPTHIVNAHLKNGKDHIYLFAASESECSLFIKGFIKEQEDNDMRERLLSLIERIASGDTSFLKPSVHAPFAPFPGWEAQQAKKEE